MPLFVVASYPLFPSSCYCTSQSSGHPCSSCPSSCHCHPNRSTPRIVSDGWTCEVQLERVTRGPASPPLSKHCGPAMGTLVGGTSWVRPTSGRGWGSFQSTKPSMAALKGRTASPTSEACKPRRKSTTMHNLSLDMLGRPTLFRLVGKLNFPSMHPQFDLTSRRIVLVVCVLHPCRPAYPRACLTHNCEDVSLMDSISGAAALPAAR